MMGWPERLVAPWAHGRSPTRREIILHRARKYADRIVGSDSFSRVCVRYTCVVNAYVAGCNQGLKGRKRL